ncbi:MAG: GNAT family N-acetyltransferase [Candidatus Eisenbacteria bacterium]|uniref:GNAT family N-acetyltransferase n=1 Tax=Eiseniibacteriota bacterium TaxID=2212470 RepID=A0A948WBZ9_UNCEI|nr:GNAT family N-acetyltransferase [Candidatus Eisenbacteria bacterium]MBU1949385.1 GNAT family N-acetyltransferase [Candidatus Eisenbacteria bacterium]MBU2690458.1 GNAT family N-acetyltransferase [Candidatus Eisenbacteria bacterium]
MYEAARESELQVYPWLPWCHPGYSLAEAENWAAFQALAFGQGREYEFVITDGTGRFLGGCGLNHINVADRCANLGYWVRTQETGREVALKAVRRVVEFAFTRTNLERLEIVCAVENRASRRVAEKSGAVREGVARGRIFLHGQVLDAVVYSILRSDVAAV